MNKKIERYFPPGIFIEQERIWVRIFIILSILISFGFLISYSQSYDNLFTMYNEHRYLKKGAMIEPFFTILGRSLHFFLISDVAVLALMIKHYIYFYQGESKSIYLMKRLPSNKEFVKRIVAYPLIMTLIITIIAILIFVTYTCIYFNITPQVCRPRWY